MSDVRVCWAHGRVGAAGLAVGGIVGIAAAVKTADQRLKKQNLADLRGHQPVHKGPPADIPGDGKTKSLEKMGEGHEGL